MRGERKSITLDKKGDDAPILTYSIREAFNLPERSGSVTVPEEAVSTLLRIFHDNRMGSWPPLRTWEVHLLDAPSESVSISVDGERCSFTHEDVLPKGCGGLLWDIADILKGYIPKERA